MTDAITTDRLLLRPPVAADVEAYFAVFGDAQANAANPRGRCADLAAAAVALQGHIDRWASDGFDVWAVCERERPGAVVGFGGVGLWRFGEKPRLNLGYGLHASVFGRGYAKEIARAGVEAARERASFGELWARVHRDNAASRRVLEAAGLVVQPQDVDVDELWYRRVLQRPAGR
jgi:RimJ/RimL family protein N-acetyltransferase